MEEKTTHTEQKAHHARQLHKANRDSTLALVSFYGAAVFGVGTILNNIRQKFHQNFVLGYGETRTPFTPIVEKYNGKQFMPKEHAVKSYVKSNFPQDSSHSPALGLFDTLSLKAEHGKIKTAEFLAERDTLRHKFRKEIDKKLLEDFGIPTNNAIKDWTVGTWKRLELMGNTSRIDSSLGFASVTAFSIAAISLLRHNRHMLERVEKDIDERSR